MVGFSNTSGCYYPIVTMRTLSNGSVGIVENSLTMNSKINLYFYIDFSTLTSYEYLNELKLKIKYSEAGSGTFLQIKRIRDYGDISEDEYLSEDTGEISEEEADFHGYLYGSEDTKEIDITNLALEQLKAGYSKVCFRMRLNESDTNYTIKFNDLNLAVKGYISTKQDLYTSKELFNNTNIIYNHNKDYIYIVSKPYTFNYKGIELRNNLICKFNKNLKLISYNAFSSKFNITKLNKEKMMITNEIGYHLIYYKMKDNPNWFYCSDNHSLLNYDTENEKIKYKVNGYEYSLDFNNYNIKKISKGTNCLVFTYEDNVLKNIKKGKNDDNGDTNSSSLSTFITFTDYEIKCVSCEKKLDIFNDDSIISKMIEYNIDNNSNISTVVSSLEIEYENTNYLKDFFVNDHELYSISSENTNEIIIHEEYTNDYYTLGKNESYSFLKDNYNNTFKNYFNGNNEVIYSVEERNGKVFNRSCLAYTDNLLKQSKNLFVRNLFPDSNFNKLLHQISYLNGNDYTFENKQSLDNVVTNIDFFSGLSRNEYVFSPCSENIERSLSINFDISIKPDDILNLTALAKLDINNQDEYMKINMVLYEDEESEGTSYTLKMNSNDLEYQFNSTQFIINRSYNHMLLEIKFKGKSEARISNIYIYKSRNINKIDYSDDLNIKGITTNDTIIYSSSGDFNSDTRYTYLRDNMGNYVTETFEYEKLEDSENRSKGDIVEYTYDDNDLLIERTSKVNNFYSSEIYEYDENDNLIESNIDGEKSYYFNKNFQDKSVIQKIDSTGLLDKEIIEVDNLTNYKTTKYYQKNNLMEKNTFHYVNNRLSLIESFDNTKYNFNYDIKNRLTSIYIDGNQYISFKYSDEKTYELKQKGYWTENIINFDYDDYGRIVQVYHSNLSGTKVNIIATYEYDDLNRISKIKDASDADEHLYEYDDFGNISKCIGQDIEYKYDYNINNELSNIKYDFKNKENIHNYQVQTVDNSISQFFKEISSNIYQDYYFPNESGITLYNNFYSSGTNSDTVIYDEKLKRNISTSDVIFNNFRVMINRPIHDEGKYYKGTYYKHSDYLNKIEYNFGVMEICRISNFIGGSGIIYRFVTGTENIETLELFIDSDLQIKLTSYDYDDETKEFITTIYPTGMYIELDNWIMLGMVLLKNDNQIQIIYNDNLVTIDWPKSKMYEDVSINSQNNYYFTIDMAYFTYGNLRVNKSIIKRWYNKIDYLFNKGIPNETIQTTIYDVYDNQSLNKISFNNTFVSQNDIKPSDVSADGLYLNYNNRYFVYENEINKYCYESSKEKKSILKYYVTQDNVNNNKLIVSAYVKLLSDEIEMYNTIFSILNEQDEEKVKLTYKDSRIYLYINDVLYQSFKDEFVLNKFNFIKLFIDTNKIIVVINDCIHEYNIDNLSLSDVILNIGNDNSDNYFEGLYSDLVFGYVNEDTNTRKNNSQFIYKYDENNRLRTKKINCGENNIETVYSYYDSLIEDGKKKYNPLVNRVKNYDDSEEIISYNENYSIIKRVLIKDNTIIKITNYQYDDFNRLIEEVRYELSSNEILTETYKGKYEYDNYGNLVRNQNWKDGNLSKSIKCNFVYTATSLLNNVVDEINNTEYSIDTLGYTYIRSMGGKPLEYEGKRLVKYGNNYYQYDSLGNRIKKITEDNQIYEYTYIENNLVRQKTNDITLDYIYNNSLIEGIRYNGNDYYFIRDITGCIEKIIDKNKKEMVLYSYTSYGEVESKIGTSLADSEIEIANILKDNNGFVYKGYYYDVETNLFLVSSRYYSPELCRWISPDDIEYLDPESVNGLNLYCYCFNNPIMYIDPDGHAPKWWESILWGVGIIAVAALAAAAIVYTGGGAAAFFAAAGQAALGGLKIAAVAGATAGIVRAGKTAIEGGDLGDVGKSLVLGFSDGFLAGSVYAAGSMLLGAASFRISGLINNGYGWSLGSYSGGYQTPKTPGISLFTINGGINGGRSFGLDLDIYNGLHFHTNKFGIGKRSNWIKAHHWMWAPIGIGIGAGLSDGWSEW